MPAISSASSTTITEISRQPGNAGNAPDPDAIQYQLIVDDNNRAAGFDLLFPTPLSPQTMLSMYESWNKVLELDRLPDRPPRPSFIRCAPDILHSEEIEHLSPQSVILELVIHTSPDSDLIQRCRMLHDRGFSLAISDYKGLDDCCRPLLSLLDIVGVELRGIDEDQCHALAGSLASLPITLLAKGVDTATQLECCCRAGFQLFQGMGIAPRKTFRRKLLPVARSRLTYFLHLVQGGADANRLEDAFKKEPALLCNLLCLPQLTTHARGRGTHGLWDALESLGAHALSNWLQFQLLEEPPASTAPPYPQLHLQAAALRGRMLELLMHEITPHDRRLLDAAYLTGYLSVMPGVLDLSMRELLQAIPVEQDISTALLDHKGILGQTLGALEGFDRRDMCACAAPLEPWASEKDTCALLTGCFTEALAWLADVEN